MNAFCRALELSAPVIQAPMAGGGDTPELAAEVCRAGGLGCLGLNYTDPDAIQSLCSELRARTSRPFCANLFAPSPPSPGAPVAAAVARLRAYYRELGTEPPASLAPSFSFDAQFEAILQSGAAVFSFTCGVLPRACVMAAKAAGMLVLGTATTVREARVLVDTGVDGVIAQGSEAGGHRASFLSGQGDTLVGISTLVPQISAAVSVPVIATGGVMDGRGVLACRVSGASAVQMGTAFLGCPESGVPTAYREALFAADEESTMVTAAFSGKPARGIANRFTREMAGPSTPIAGFPVQNALTRPLRAAAAASGRGEFLSLWAGQGVRMCRRLAAFSLVQALQDEMRSAASGIT
jgi:nitronate monooxygenase